MESGERCKTSPQSLLPGSLPRNQQVAPFPATAFQAVDLRLDGLPIWFPLALRVQDCRQGLAAGGARAYDKGFTGLKAREEGLAAHPESAGAWCGGWRGGRGGRQPTASNLQPHLYRGRQRVSPAPAASPWCSAPGRGARPVAASVCELTPTARGP